MCVYSSLQIFQWYTNTLDTEYKITIVIILSLRKKRRGNNTFIVGASVSIQ